jgi:hypothetical protein
MILDRGGDTKGRLDFRVGPDEPSPRMHKRKGDTIGESLV